MVGGETTIRPNDRAQLALAAVAGEDPEEVGGDRVERQFGAERGKRLSRLVAADQRAGDQLGKVLRIGERRAERIEAAADGVDLALITGKVEQSGRVAPC